MKKHLLLFVFAFVLCNLSFSQTTFSSEGDVYKYTNGKVFISSDGKRKIKVGYISNGIGVEVNGIQTHFNLDVTVLTSTTALITGESLTNPDGVIRIKVNTKTGCLENMGDYFCWKKKS